MCKSSVLLYYQQQSLCNPSFHGEKSSAGVGSYKVKSDNSSLFCSFFVGIMPSFEIINGF